MITSLCCRDIINTAITTSIRYRITLLPSRCYKFGSRTTGRTLVVVDTSTYFSRGNCGLSGDSCSYRLTRPRIAINQVRTMGQGVIIEDGKTIINRNPATNEIISRVPCTTTSEIQDMMDTAQTAFNTVWGNHKSIKERINCLQVAMEELSKKGTDLIPLIVQEMGKPIAEATAEFNAACNKRNGQYMTLLEHSLQPIQHGTNSVVIRQPLGVAAILSPWNFPLDEILLLALPALGSGNTVIVKPSEVTPEVGALVVNTLASMLPKGVLQLAQGDGIVGAQLVSHPITRMVAMTGSSATGKHIMKEATKDLKRLVLELGGKDPMVVFDDCDVEKAARDAVEYSLCNAGQVCCSIERVYVADSIYNTFCDQVKQVASAYKVGNGMNPNNKIGPLVSSLQMLKVKEQVDDAIQNGATLLYQSETPTTGDERLGTFYPVTVLADVKDGMKLYREETFGPVVCISKFDNTESEAIRLANDTDYGLGSCVYTQDVGKATRIANQIEAGQVGINCYAIDNMDISCPWVGHKQSGYGYHSGKEGFHNFSIPKTIVYSDAIPK